MDERPSVRDETFAEPDEACLNRAKRLLNWTKRLLKLSLLLLTRNSMRLLIILVFGLLPTQLWSQEPESLGKPVRVIGAIPGPKASPLDPMARGT